MKIWEDRDSTKSHVGLTNEAAAVIGLLSMGIDDLDEIAGLLLGRGSLKGKRRFAELVSHSRNPVILRAKIRPPSDLSGEIKNAIRCPTCGCKVFFVPCRYCSGIGFSAVYTDVQEDDNRASSPTRHLPGTAGKLMVLAARAEMGEPLWHPADGAWPWPVRGGRFRNLGGILARCRELAEDIWCVPEGEEGPEVSDLLT